MAAVLLAAAMAFAGRADAQQADARQAEIAAISREAEPMRWAAAQVKAGEEYLLEPDRLSDAAAAFRAALEVYSKRVKPKEWADTKRRLATADLQIATGELVARKMIGLGGQAAPSIDPAPELKEAALALLDAQQVYTRRSAPADWAELRFLQGVIYHQLAEESRFDPSARAEKDARAFRKQALTSFKDALKVYDSERDPLRWAAVQQGLAGLYQDMSQDDEKHRPLALDALKAAQDGFTRAGRPELAEALERDIASLQADIEYDRQQ